MSLELYKQGLTLPVAKALYPGLIHAGTNLLAKLIRAVINYLIRKNTDSIAELQLDKSMFPDLSVLREDGVDRWCHVFTDKNGHVNPSRDEERGMVALVLKMVQKLGANVPVLSKAAENFKRRYELYFKETNIRMWVRECRKGQSDEYYIESGGMYIDEEASPNELDTGGELLKIL